MLVDQRQAGVEVERLGQGRAPGRGRRGTRAGAPTSVSRRNSGVKRASRSRGCTTRLIASIRADRVAAGERLQATGAGGLGRAETRAPEPPLRARAGTRPQQVGRAGDLVLAVAAEQLVGPLTGERHGDRLPREPAEQQQADAGEVGDRLLQVAQRVVEQVGVVERRGLQLVVVGAEALAPPCRASASSLASASSTKPIEKVWTGRSEASAISAAIRLESRPPLSITPSGTSLTIRARVAVRSSSSRRSPSSSQEAPGGSAAPSQGVQ